MKKRALAIALVFSITFGGLSISETTTAAGAVKCGLAKPIKVVKNGKTTCVAKAPPVAKPKPTPTPTPTGPAKPISFENLDSKWTSVVAREAIVAAMLSAPEVTSVKISTLLGPSLTKSRADIEKSAMQRTINLIGPYWAPKRFDLIYFTAKDAAWVDGAIASVGGNIYATPNGQSFGQWVASTSGMDCNMASAGADMIWTQCLGDGVSIPTPTRQTGPHEYFHFFQSAFQTDRVFWVVEGTAQFIGQAVGFYPDLSGQSRREWWAKSQNEIDAEARQMISNKDYVGIENRMKALESINAQSPYSRSAYLFGWLASECMVASFGWDKFAKFIMHNNDGSSTKEAFKKIYGISMDDFYPKLAKYIID